MNSEETRIERGEPSFTIEIGRRIEDALGVPVEIVIVNNSSTMLRKTVLANRSIRIRIHSIFEQAPAEVVAGLVAWARRPSRNAGAPIDDYIYKNRDRVARNRSAASPASRGSNIDLSEILQTLNGRYFSGSIECAIGFATVRASRRRVRRAIQYGVYDTFHREIRIHPVLDQPWIPRFFVEFIVYHEMLHARFGIGRDRSGRRAHHTRDFRSAESQFEHFDAARQFEKKHFLQILQSAHALSQKRRLQRNTPHP